MEGGPALAEGRLVYPIIDVLLVNAVVVPREMQDEFEFALDEFEDGVVKEGQALGVLEEVHFYR